MPENDKVSVDHAYEIGFLKSFMESIIDKPNGLTCANANSQFFDTGSCSDNRLQPIFGSLPSYENPDFIAMSQWLNGDAKGWVRYCPPQNKLTTIPDLAFRFLGRPSIPPLEDPSCPAAKSGRSIAFQTL